MANQQICLKWNGFHSSITTSFECLWEEQGLVDVTLASDGQCIRAHKVILSACSPFFKIMFETNPCQHPVIILQDIHFSEIESLLCFMYKGEVNIDEANLPSLLRAAETLQIRGLSGASEQVQKKLGAPQKPLSTEKKHEISPDGLPPRKRQRSVLKSHSPPPPLTPVAATPTSQPSPPQSEQPTEAAFPCQVEVIETECYSPPMMVVEECYEESNDDSMDLMAKNALLESEQHTEIAKASVIEDFAEGAMYATFSEFQTAFHNWADKDHHPMTIMRSFGNPHKSEEYPYLKVRYSCKHHGKPKPRGKNMRPKQHYYGNECPVSVTVRLHKPLKQYLVKSVISTHNHPVSALLRSQYPDKRILKGSQREAVSLLIQSNVKSNEIRQVIEKQMGKLLTNKDVHNMRKQIRAKDLALGKPVIQDITKDMALKDHGYHGGRLPNKIDLANLSNNSREIHHPLK